MVLPCTFICLGYQKRKERSVPVRSHRSVRSDTSARSLLNNVPSNHQVNTPFQPHMQLATVPLSNIATAS